MVDSKLKALAVTTEFNLTDLLYVLKDPSGTPLDRAIAAQTIVDRISDPLYEANARVGWASAVGLVKDSTGWLDDYTDETGVDTDASENDEYSSDDGGYYTSLAIVPADSFTIALNSNGAGNNNWSIRQVLPAASLSNSGAAIRITLTGNTANTTNLDHVSIVERDGTTDDGTTTPTEITFSGSSGVNIALGGTATSDWISFTLDDTKDYLLIMDHSSSSAHRYNSSTGTFYYNTNADSWDQQTVSGFSAFTGTSAITKLEVAAAMGGDLTLVSAAYEATTNDPDNASVLALIKDNEAVTINTDYTMEFSIDNGATWESLTGTVLYDTGIYLVCQFDKKGLTPTGDATCRYRFKILNGKDLEIHGIRTVLEWS